MLQLSIILKIYVGMDYRLDDGSVEPNNVARIKY